MQNKQILPLMMNGNIQYIYLVSIKSCKQPLPYLNEHFLTYKVICIQDVA